VSVKAIYEVLQAEYLSTPQEEHEWYLGVLDGKHIAFRAKKNDGSYY
jgi:hypothetical protein